MYPESNHLSASFTAAWFKSPACLQRALWSLLTALTPSLPSPSQTHALDHTHRQIHCTRSFKMFITAHKTNTSMQNRQRDTDVQNRLWDSVGEGEGGMFRENSIETSILSRVKQVTSPGWMHETGAQGWCTGKTQRDGMGKEAGGGVGEGNTCKSMADSCQCMAKTTTIL